MLSREDNELLTQVGPGTPGGELLRRYWMPVSTLADFNQGEPKKRVRVLGENLVLFRDASGNIGLIPERCPHRHASLYNGFLEKDGLRCPYHGWKFAANGECIEQPFEGGNAALKKKAYQRFEELIKQATAPSAAETEAPEAQSLSIWLSPAVRRALEQHATAVGSTPSEVVEEAVRRYLVERPG